MKDPTETTTTDTRKPMSFKCDLDNYAYYESLANARGGKEKYQFQVYVNACMAFYRKYHDDANLEPYIASQQRILLQLETFSSTFQSQGAIDYDRLNLPAKMVGEQVCAQLRHIDHRASQSGIEAIAAYRIRVRRAFAGGAIAGSLAGIGLVTILCWLF